MNFSFTGELRIADILQLAVVGAALWLSWETRFLRVKTAEETDILRDQARADQNPILRFPSFLPDKAGTTAGTLRVTNLSKAPAFRLDTWLYDSNNRNLVTAMKFETYLAGFSQVDVPIDGTKRYSRQQAATQVSTINHVPEKHVLPTFTDSEEDYVIVFYSDIVNRLSYVKSEVTYDASGDCDGIGTAVCGDFYDH